MTRTLSALAATLVLCGAAAATASADTYTLTASTGPAGAGSPAAPLAKELTLDYRAAGVDGARPAPLRDMVVEAQGLLAFSRPFPACTMAQAEEVELVDVLAGCAAAQVGSGRVEAVIGLSHDRTDQVPCELDLRIFNIGRRRLALRLDRHADQDCLVDPEVAFAARLKRARVSGRPSDRLIFSLPDVLRHPIDGLDATITRVQATLKSALVRTRVGGKRRRVGFLSSVGCDKRGRRRLVRVTVVDESGAGGRAQTRVAC